MPDSVGASVVSAVVHRRARSHARGCACVSRTLTFFCETGEMAQSTQSVQVPTAPWSLPSPRADSPATSPPACLLTRSRREVPEAFLSPHACGLWTPRSLSHPSRLRDFATLRVEKRSPQSGPSSTDRHEVAQCVKLTGTAFHGGAATCGGSVPGTTQSSDRSPLLRWPTPCHGKRRRQQS